MLHCSWLLLLLYLTAGADYEELQQPIEFVAKEVHLYVGIHRFENSFMAFNTRSFNGMVPSPTLRISPGETFTLHLHNHLAVGEGNITNIHTHGLHVSPEGIQDNVFLDVKSGNRQTYEYTIPIDHPAGTFWYHPHHHGAVNSQITGMMAGALIVSDRGTDDFPVELAQMNDRVLLLQAVCFEKCDNIWDNLPDALSNVYQGDVGFDQPQRSFNADLDVKTLPLNNPSVLHVLVNGQYQPVISLQPREFQRFRYINAIANNMVELRASNECEAYVIAMDGIYWDAPKLKDIIIIPPGGRADVAFRCTTTGTFSVSIDHDPVRNDVLGQEHRVRSQLILTLAVSGTAMDMQLPICLPARPTYLNSLVETATVPESQRYEYQFTVWPNKVTGTPHFGVNHQLFDIEAGANHTMAVGSVQEWEISTGFYGFDCPVERCHKMNHPFHMHGTHFQVIKENTNGLLYEVGEWRDTIPIFSDTVAIRFKPLHVGRVLTHCHVVAHADGGMAQMIDVVN